MLRVVSPHATAFAARCKPSDLRDWRRHGYLDGCGERDGKGHRFSINEVARIAVAVLLGRSGASMREAFAVVRDRSSTIDALTSRAGVLGDDYVLTLGIDPDVKDRFVSFTSAPIASVSFAEPLHVAVQLNISLIIRSALDRVAFHDQNLAGAIS